ncbi:MutS-related protein [Xanthocytophaga agilis]|uniref:DNA mismatch repair protein MutS n=1 Tax=Xanthocytophaga agilis TaxID=3048010 RepID=A0AAE3QX26_9BACT|nr:DNA mismatch repair protein MutS [Xanthocytophaga agilis]MDJ1499649.1 DNA mismatch repair protein MutS [Xanthocytophaga agilis]
MDLYHQKIAQYQSTLTKTEAELSRLSLLRIAVFLASAIVVVILANNRALAPLLIVAPICLVALGIMIKRYNALLYVKKQTAFLKEVNEQEAARSSNRLSDFPTGDIFVNREHPYAADLDVFGKHSLFQLINRTTTESGSMRLAEWLSEPAANTIILERQQAVKELTPKLEWRQDFQAAGMHHQNAKSDYAKLLTWVEKPEVLLPHRTKHLVTAISLGVLTAVATIYALANIFSSTALLDMVPLLVLLMINFFVLKKVGPLAEETIDNTHQNVKILAGYQALITRIETEQFHARLLVQLHSVFSQNNYSAAQEIDKLKNILDVFKLRGTRANPVGRNPFYTVYFNTFWLLDIYLILQTEKWKHKNRIFLKEWISSVSEFEVLNSIAGFAYSNPSFTFPQIQDELYVIEFTTLGHPLLPTERRICNDFTLKGRGEIAVITGSNMAGKSTFLRTVGLNLVLALMGAPCCAQSGRVSNMMLFTSMRTQDNLEEGVSSFYAELKRIEQLLKLLEQQQPLFFLLDEIFKGTNSQDRYRGGVSLIRQLNELNAFGIISTHDLELAKLAANHMIVANYSFNSAIREGKMIFDYTLTEGICTDFNASELMKKSGIRILSDIEQL